MTTKLKTKNGRNLSDASIHKRLAELRKARGISQATVAESLGLTQVLISNYESGERRLHADLIVAFAKFYGVPADDLLGIEAVRKRRNSDEGRTDIALHLTKRMQKIQLLPKRKQKEVLRGLDLLLVGATTEQNGK